MTVNKAVVNNPDSVVATKKDLVEKLKCFIITPIGSENSLIRKKTEGLLSDVIEPVCSELGYDAIPAHKMQNPGSITSQVIDAIINYDMVIANLTGLNANVMYELAVRHATKKPVVCIAENDTKLPFDITTERTIFYTDDMFGASNLREELKEKMKAATQETAIDNPIYRGISQKNLITQIDSSNETPETKKILLTIFDRLDIITNRLNDIQSKRKSSMFLVIEIDKKYEPIDSEKIRTILFNNSFYPVRLDITPNDKGNGIIITCILDTPINKIMLDSLVLSLMKSGYRIKKYDMS